MSILWFSTDLLKISIKQNENKNKHKYYILKFQSASGFCSGKLRIWLEIIIFPKPLSSTSILLRKQINFSTRHFMKIINSLWLILWHFTTKPVSGPWNYGLFWAELHFFFILMCQNVIFKLLNTEKKCISQLYMKKKQRFSAIQISIEKKFDVTF
jgi:hypothetical protein